MSNPTDNPLKKLIGEIHRRSLWQVLGIYLLGSWFVYEVVQGLTEGLGLPEWFPALAVVLLLIGLPIVLATAFIQQGAPGQTQPSVSITTMDELYPAASEPTVSARLFTWEKAILGGAAALILFIGVGVGWIMFGDGTTSGTAEPLASIGPSIAVLPFDDLSPGGDQQYFVEGLSEGILNALTQISGLKVAARTSAFLLAEQGADIEAVANTLGVATVMEGSVQRAGDQLRITAQLIEAQSGFRLWSESFDRELIDVFAIQDEIARAIAERLQVTLSGDQQSQLVAEATDSPSAYEAYLLGRDLLEQRSPEGTRNAIIQFERAVALDSSYAEAYVGLADSYVLGGSFDWFPDYRASIDTGLAAARRALDLDPDLGSAYTSIGFAHWNYGNWDEAEEAFQDAIRLRPQYALAHQWYALLLLTTGGAEESVIEAQQARDLDPVYRQAYRNLAWALEAAGRIEDAIDTSQEMINLSPTWQVGWDHHAQLLLESGEYERGLEAALEAAGLLGLDLEEKLSQP